MNIHLIGCGGSSQQIIICLLQLCALYRRSLTLWDGDTFEEKNTHRQFMARRHLGRNKAEVMAEFAASVVDGVTVTAESQYFSCDYAPRERAAYLCLADNNRARVECKEAVDNYGGILVFAGSEGNFGEGFVYTKMCKLNPFELFPDILEDRSGDPTAGCASEAGLEGNPQNPWQNLMSGTLAVHILCNWLFDQCRDIKHNAAGYRWSKNRIFSVNIETGHE